MGQAKAQTATIRATLTRMKLAVLLPKIHRGIRTRIREIQITATVLLDLVAPMTLAVLVAVTTLVTVMAQARVADREVLAIALAHRSVLWDKERNSNTQYGYSGNAQHYYLQSKVISD